VGISLVSTAGGAVAFVLAVMCACAVDAGRLELHWAVFGAAASHQRSRGDQACLSAGCRCFCCDVRFRFWYSSAQVHELHRAVVDAVTSRRRAVGAKSVDHCRKNESCFNCGLPSHFRWV
jgi:hypothetical protein